MANTTRYFLQIDKNSNGSYRSCVHQGEPSEETWAKDLLLQPDSQVIIKGQSFSLTQLVDILINYDDNDLSLVFDERGQLEMGQHLFAQTLGKLKPSFQNKILQYENLDLRVLCPDEHIASLPWVLLADKGIFLSAAKKCSVALALADRIETEQVSLVLYPQLLIVAPQPNGVTETEAQAHINELRELLSWGRTVEKRFQIAYTWEQFQTHLESLQPEILYYYGHGEGEKGGASYLLFADQDQHLCKKTVADVALLLRRYPPKLAYINCCQGNVGGWLGVGQQLGHFIPAVITNRTIAQISAARAQALAFWQGLLLEGLPPHEAIASMRNRLVDDGMGLGDARWMTPVWHCHYQHWQTIRPSMTNLLKRDSLWRLKLDRTGQISKIFYQIMEIMELNIPSFAYIWYGKNGQGVEIFHERLEYDLGKKLAANNITVETRKPSWPTDFANLNLSFRDMYLECFEVQTLEEIPYRIPKYTKTKTLLYVCHQPVSPSYLTKKRLSQYLKWWDNHLIPLLESANIYSLLGISFLIEDTVDFYTKLSKRLDTLKLNYLSVDILEELGCVSQKDLYMFLKVNRVPLADDDQKRLVNKIMQKTHGEYEQTLEELKIIASRGWEVEENANEEEEDDDEW